MRYKKLLWAIALSGFAQSSQATFPDLNSMLQALAPVAPVQAPELNPLILSLNALAPYPAVQSDALFTLVPLADGSLRAASDGPMWQVLSVIAERLLTIEQGEETSGYSAGDMADLSKATKVHAAWGQLLGDHLQQGIREGVPGYRADVAGGMIGRDLFLATNFIVGVAGGYQHARVNQQDLSGSFFTINRYQGTAYTRYRLCDWPIYILGAATLAADRYENSRYILVPPSSGNVGYSVISNAEFTGWESNVYLENGYVWKCGNFRAVPKVILMYSHLDVDSYNESDALALNLTVKYQDQDELLLGLGGKIDYRNRFQNAYVIPEAHVYIFHDFIHDAQIATAEFFSGGYAFLSQGPAPEPNSVEVGASLAIHSYRNTVAKIQYDYTARDTYHRHGAFIKIRHEWA